MENGVIEILCDGDFPGIDLARKYFTLEDMEKLVAIRAEKGLV